MNDSEFMVTAATKPITMETIMPDAKPTLQDHDVEDQSKPGSFFHVENFEDRETQSAYAIKGDDSDGNVPWTMKRLLATLSLYGLFVGASLPLYFLGASESFIVKDLGNGKVLGWLTTVYSVLLAAVVPFCGYLQDLVGRRYVAIAGSTLLCIGIIILSTAHSLSQLLVGSCLCGAGAGMAELTAIAGVAETFAVKSRGWPLSIISGFVLPFCPYLLYSELLGSTGPGGWRWGFWITLIYNVITLVGVVFTYFPKSHHRADGMTRRQLVKELDLVGVFLSLAGVVLILVALQSGGVSIPWKNAGVITPLVFGIIFIIAFVVWEWKWAKYPMLPSGIFKGQHVTSYALGIAFVAGMNLFALLNFMPLALGTVYNPDPLQVGLKGLGYGFSATIGGIVMTGMLSVFKNHNREVLLVACLMMTGFTASLVAMTPHNPAMAVVLSSFGAFGIGGILNPAATVAISATPDIFIATVVAMSLTLRFIGGAIGYSIYYSIFTQKLDVKLPAYIAKYAIEAGLPPSSAVEFVTAFLTTPAMVPKISGVTAEIIAGATLGSQWAYADSLKFVWLTSIPFGVLCVVGCLLMGNNKKFLTSRVVAKLE